MCSPALTHTHTHTHTHKQRSILIHTHTHTHTRKRGTYPVSLSHSLREVLVQCGETQTNTHIHTHTHTHTHRKEEVRSSVPLSLPLRVADAVWGKRHKKAKPQFFF